uniref:Uncharacterized protein n=1 Tax=Siphoviridae sp. ctvuW5 TaxID=2825725 RepID=A0A8S5TXA3_9CAUD|nr:MAG TPA: hypothetical protein [Siphoviridae sp. ctvuW5]
MLSPNPGFITYIHYLKSFTSPTITATKQRIFMRLFW